MKRYNFSPDDIDLNMHTPQQWYEFVRKSELNYVLSSLETNLGCTLEVGAGNGFQSLMLSKHCEKLICTEIDINSHAKLGGNFLAKNENNVEYIICDARDLTSFPDKSFDTIYSSNLLEHVDPIDAALSEFHRVLRDGGQMLHLMPSRTWKVSYFLGSLMKRQRPQIHGAYPSHFREYIFYGCNKWKRVFEKNRFAIKTIVGMPYYLGHENRFQKIIKLGNSLQLSGSYLYVIRKQT